jgi:hypothetical protein
MILLIPSRKGGDIKQIIVGSMNIDFISKSKIKDKDSEVEHWLNKQNGTVMIQVFHIKLFWLYVFNKKRPSMIPNFIIPSEYEMLDAFENVVGSLNCNVSFIQDKKLKIVWDSKQMPQVFLLSGKMTIHAFKR